MNYENSIYNELVGVLVVALRMFSCRLKIQSCSLPLVKKKKRRKTNLRTTLFDNRTMWNCPAGL